MKSKISKKSGTNVKFRILKKTAKFLVSGMIVITVLTGFKILEYSMEDYKWSSILSIIGIENNTISYDIASEQWRTEVQLDAKNSIELREFLIDTGGYNEFRTRQTYEKAMVILNKIKEKNKPFKNENKDKNILHYLTACRYEKLIKENLYEKSYEKSYEKNETVDNSIIEP